jgi:hypothetical protein
VTIRREVVTKRRSHRIYVRLLGLRPVNKGFATPYNYGRPEARRHESFVSLLRRAAN